MILLENMQTAAENSSGKEFRDDILPIILLALDSPTHALVDAALGTLPHVLPVLDFSTIKNEFFPVIAAVFAKTSSLAIKIKGLEAFYTLCGGSGDTAAEEQDDLNGIGVPESKATKLTGSAVLDKFTVQEKVVPLLKGIKTKEPGVMMAALKVFRQVGQVADSDFLAMDVLPVLWSFSLGPLLNLQQFQAYMVLIRTMSTKIEREQTRKLKEMGSTNGAANARTSGLGARAAAADANGLTNGEETDFESLVSGRKTANGGADMMDDWGASVARPTTTRTQSQQQAPTFSWQTNAPSSQTPQPQLSQLNTLRPQTMNQRSITPDQSMNSFTALTPASPFSQPLQPGRPSSSSTMPLRPAQPSVPAATTQSLDWSSAATNTAAAWSSQRPVQPAKTNGAGPFSIAPPPMSPQAFASPQVGGFPGFKPPPSGGVLQPQNSNANGRGGLDKYESLI